MSGGIFYGHHWQEKGGSTGIRWEEAGAAANHPTTKGSPTTTSCPAADVSDAEAEDPCPKRIRSPDAPNKAVRQARPGPTSCQGNCGPGGRCCVWAQSLAEGSQGGEGLETGGISGKTNHPGLPTGLGDQRWAPLDRAGRPSALWACSGRGQGLSLRERSH